MFESWTKILSKIISFFLIPMNSIRGQSIAEFAVITAMMSTFVATAAPRLSNLMEEGKTVFPNGAHVNGAEVGKQL